MGFLSSLFGKNKSQPAAADAWRGPGVFVRVAFRDLTQANPGPDSHGRYTYVWAVDPAPLVGSRAFVRGGDGEPAAVVVTDFGLPEDLDGYDPAQILRAATPRDIAKAERAAGQAAAESALVATIWLDMMRAAAGLALVGGQLSRQVPSGYPSIPPAEGTTRNAEEADAYGRAWWRAYKHDGAGAAAPRFRELGQRWYDVRDAILDPAKAAADDERRAREAERQRAGLVRGRFFAEWAEDVQQLKRENRLEEAHALLVECIGATWLADGNRPAVWPFEQAAIVLRKMKRPEDEAAVLSAYVSGSAEPNAKLVERLAKLTDLT